ncbi:MAG TPA: PKD domain-containing protein [Vicinamibacterales bacterium]|nr:PKD domain-containing protein [Vicinamibacterales bacterium]
MTRRVLALAAVIALSGCSLDNQGAPPLAGPSELGLSLEITATPDVITQDGQSQAVVQVIARDANSRPVSGLDMRVDTSVDGQLADFGRLSTHSASTGTDGKATVTYYAPAAPPATATSDTTVGVVVTPIGSNYANALPRTVAIHLMRPGSIVAIGNLQPDFFFSPTSPKEEDEVLFDASITPNAGNIVSYKWDFGDGETGFGMRITHSYVVAATYNVILTVTNDHGVSASTAPKPVAVAAADKPSVTFTFSPASPVVGQDVFFNAAQTTVATGRTIRSYDWDFGDGSPHASGVSPSHRYAVEGAYVVTLTLTDDTGRTTAVSQSVKVSNTKPQAAFTFSPTAPHAGTPITFNAGTTTVAPGRTIVSYAWDFGNGATGTGQTTSYAGYLTDGSYVVTLTVTDSSGEVGVASNTVTVTP